MRTETRQLVLAVACLGSLSQAACKGSDKSGKVQAAQVTNTTTSSAEASEQAPRAQPIFEVDGKAIDVAPIGDEVALLSLTALPPIDDWASVIARSVDGREFQGSSPMLLTGTRTMNLVKLDAGYEFRVMDTNDVGPYVRHKMTRVERVLIFTKDYKAPELAAPSLQLVDRKGTELVLSDQLATVTRTPEPGEKKARDTWKLSDLIVELANDTEMQSLVLSNPGGETLELSANDLQAETLLHIIKRNRRGEFNYRAWTLGETPSKSTELRGLSTIELR